MSVNYKTENINIDFLENIPCEFKVKCYNNKSTYNCKVNIEEIQIVDLEDDIINNKDVLIDKKYHEWIKKDDYVKPYYDIDNAYETKKEMIDAKEPLLNKWKDILNNKFPTADLVISECCRKKSKTSIENQNKPYFISFHILVNNYIIKQKDLNIINKDLESVEGYDNSVYSNGQNFRMVYQSKPDGTGKPFIPITYDQIEDLCYHVIQCHASNIETEYLLIKPIIEKKQSPPVTPTTSDDEVIADNSIPFDKLKKTIMGITTKYGYEDWWKVGSIIAKETNYSDQGLELFKEWSAIDVNNYDENYCKIQYKGWKDNADKQKLTFATLQKWYNEEHPEERVKNCKNPYKTIYLENYKLDENGEWTGSANITGLIDYMNKEFIFVRETGEIIVIEKDKWFLKKPTQFRELLLKYNFNNPAEQEKVKIAEVWFNHINRRQVLKIGFDPTNNPDDDIFNIWKGLNISKSFADTFDEDECKPLLDHILNVWCKGNETYYNYIMNWLAHLIQKPWIKMGVVICLRSTKEGAGKGVVMNLLRKIIGDNHYFQCNNLEQLTGSFNSIGEGKILINLDEAFWGKDKKKEGMLKNMITEDTKYINKKHQAQYSIEDYCNYIVSTNNDCFIPAVEGGRRFFAVELSNEYAGVSNKDKEAYFNNIIKTSAGSFAKILYNRDISNFNPRSFDKTDLLQEQIQHNWCSVRKWWFEVLNGGGLSGKAIDSGFCELGSIPYSSKKTMISPEFPPESESCWGIQKRKFKYDNNKHKMRDENGDHILEDEKIFYEKDFMYNNYEENCNGYKLDKSHFWINFKKFCVEDLYKEAQFKDNGNMKRYMMINDIKIYQNKFNELQDYEYEYSVNEFEDWE